MQQAASNKKTILVVDDEDGIREILQSELEDAGYKVLVAESGNNAFDIVTRHHVDIVLSDIRMPNGTGVQLLKMIKDRNPDRPIVLFISGFSDVTLEDAYNLGAEGIMSKPWDPETLLKTIENLMEKTPTRWKRSSDRIPVSMTAQLKFSKAGSASATVLNIGQGGFFATLTHPQPKIDEFVDFTLEGPEVTLRGTGSVRWVRIAQEIKDPPGFGVEFLNFEDDGRKKLLELVKRKLTAKEE